MGTSTIGGILQNFVSGTADVQGAALVSHDGLPLASSLPGTMDEERTSAMSAAMLPLENGSVKNCPVVMLKKSWLKVPTVTVSSWVAAKMLCSSCWQISLLNKDY